MRLLHEIAYYSIRTKPLLEMFYLTMHSTHFYYGYMVSEVLKRTIHIARDETSYRHYKAYFQLAARGLLYAIMHHSADRMGNYHGLCYTSRGALAGTRNSSKDRTNDPSHHERKSYHVATYRS